MVFALTILRDIAAINLLETIFQRINYFLFLLQVFNFKKAHFSLQFSVQIHQDPRLVWINHQDNSFFYLILNPLYGLINLFVGYIYICRKLILIFKFQNYVLLPNKRLMNFFRNPKDPGLLKFDNFSFDNKFLKIHLFYSFLLREFLLLSYFHTFKTIKVRARFFFFLFFINH